MALEFIHNQNIKELDIGLYEIDGDKVFLKIQGYDTRDEEGGVWEAHKKYMDIQYMIVGAEIINIANINEMNFPTQYDEKEDLWFFTGLGDSINLEEGMFTIFLPQDVHMTSHKVNGESRSVRKAVFKVLLKRKVFNFGADWKEILMVLEWLDESVLLGVICAYSRDCKQVA